MRYVFTFMNDIILTLLCTCIHLCVRAYKHNMYVYIHHIHTHEARMLTSRRFMYTHIIYKYIYTHTSMYTYITYIKYVYIHHIHQVCNIHHIHTHGTIVLTSRRFIAYIHHTHTSQTHIHHTHTSHTYITHTHHTHTSHTYITHTHTSHTYIAYIHRIHTSHTHIHHIHTSHTYITHIHRIHTSHTYTRDYNAHFKAFHSLGFLFHSCLHVTALLKHHPDHLIFDLRLLCVCMYV